MPIKQDYVDEMNVLMQFSLDSTQAGIKVHHDAEPHVVNATKRLFEKGLVTQEDGGYLTSLGHEVAEHTQNAMMVLTRK
ncbi:TIGR02647 family protein [Flocculibacter collagenilyticus]|uniref:TIGR02647 family protein n=1 Tax=Flocculibacter collagenilyticus TaxID=2744479 RepID=UPI0018F7CF59|nr:TIGR02647 family protein [Flocculibacter collagenilyticus]